MLSLMKKLLAIIVLSLCFIIPSQADDIRDFQIEGMSIGDSLLDIMSVGEINQNILPYQKGKKKYYAVGVNSKLRSKTYKSVEAYFKTGDTKYIIRSLGAFLDISSLNDCLSKKQDIVNNIKPLFPDVMFHEQDDYHQFDKSKKSKTYSSVFLLRGNILSDHIRVDCTIWSKKMKKKHNFKDSLAVIAMKREIQDWIKGGYK